MKVLEQLFSNRWIIKEKDPKLYYEVTDNLYKYEDFLKDKLGLTLIINPEFIMLRKDAVEAEVWMGIETFKKKMSYVFLSLILMFLEDKGKEEQFILSELAEFIEDCFHTENIEKMDWTSYSDRLAMVEALKFCVEEGILKVNDGFEVDFANKGKGKGEVLYENTGLSKYFMRNFKNEIKDYKNLDDFKNITNTNDVVSLRRQKVYKKLLMNLALYYSEDTEDEFNYLRNYRNIVKENFMKYLDINLHLHKNSAFLILGEQSNLGKIFPTENMESNLILLFNKMVVEKLKNKELERDALDNIIVDKDKLYEITKEIKLRYNTMFTKEKRDMKEEKFHKEVVNNLIRYSIIEDRGEMYRILAIAGKMIGEYSEDILEDKIDE